MACRLSIKPSELLPYCAVLLVGFGLFHPSRDIREVRTLRSEFNALRAENAKLHDQFMQTVQFIRNLDLTQYLPSAAADDTGGGDEPPSTVVGVDGGRYMRSNGRDGITVGRDWWLVGDLSPWGVVESAYRGGFVADGQRYTFYAGQKTMELKHD